MVGEVAIDRRPDFRRVNVVGSDERNGLCPQVLEVSIQQEPAARNRMRRVDVADVAQSFGVAAFAASWVAKSVEFRITSAEERAVRGELKNEPGRGVVAVGNVEAV